MKIYFIIFFLFLLCLVVIFVISIRNCSIIINQRNAIRTADHDKNDEEVANQSTDVILHVGCGSRICHFDRPSERTFVEQERFVQLRFARAGDLVDQSETRSEHRGRWRRHDRANDGGCRGCSDRCDGIDFLSDWRSSCRCDRRGVRCCCCWDLR